MSKLLSVFSILILEIVKYLPQKEKIDNLSLCKKLRTLVCFLELNLKINVNSIHETLISKFPSIVELKIIEFNYLNLYKVKVLNFYKDLELIYTLSKLEKLSFLRCIIISEDLIGISKLTNLKELRLSGCHNIGDLTEIFELKNLIKLNISHCAISDLNLLGISALENLEFLDIEQNSSEGSNRISHIGLIEIFKLKKLKSLNITRFWGTKFTGISNLINLEYLYVSFCTLDDDFYLEMLKMKNIIYIKQEGCEINNIKLRDQVYEHTKNNLTKKYTKNNSQ